MLVVLAFLAVLAPAPAMAARPVPGARYADTDYAFWADLRVSPSGHWLSPRASKVENLSSWQCPGLDFHVGTPGRPVRIRRDGRFEMRRRRGRFVLTVAGRFRSPERATIRMRYRREPRRRGHECDDSGRVSLAPQRVAPPQVSDCRTHEAKTILLTPEGRVFWEDVWYGGDGWASVAYGCLFSVNRAFKLAQDDDDDSDLDTFRLVEPYVAYGHAECPMGCGLSLHVQDLRDGSLRHLPRTGGFAIGRVTDIALKATGSVGWISRAAPYSEDLRPAVWADDGQVTRLLDRGNIDLESLELSGSTLTWTRDGVQQSATLD